MLKTTIKGHQVIVICLSSNEVGLLRNLFSSVSKPKSGLSFIILYREDDAEKLKNLLRKEFGFHFHTNSSKWVIEENTHI
jgi:hypothetical protein